jgi:Zn-dependent peptidase ImmA (M78 family)
MGFMEEEAAQKIGVKPYIFKTWESGESKPTISQLRKAASVYKRPLAVFFLEKPPKEFKKPKDFRRLPREDVGETSPALSLAIRNAQRKREIAINLCGLLGEKFETKIPHYTMSRDPEEAATEARDTLGVSLSAQFAWRGKYEALRSWTEALENRGVLVFQMSGVTVNETRAFSIVEQNLPVVVINGKDFPSPRIFSIFHEYAHLMISMEGMCSFDEAGNDVRARIEQYCNRFAGAFLVPKGSLLRETVVSHKKGMEWEDPVLEGLAQKYKVSEEVILRRLLILGKTTKEFYEKKRAEFIRRTEEQQEEKGGFLLPHSRAIRDNGGVFTNLVLRAYREENITGSDVADYLGVRLKHLKKIENDMLVR